MSKEEIEEIGKYLNTQYIICRDINKTDKLSKEVRYIQKLYDSYLDLKIENNKFQKAKDYLYSEYCQNNFDIIEIKKIIEGE